MPILSRTAATRVRRLAWALLTLLPFGLLTALNASGAAGSAPGEYQVKAAFLYKLAQFVEWPATAFTDERTPLVIGVLGQDPFGPDLDAIVRDETAGTRPLVVRRFSSVTDVDTCHILFISSSESTQLERIVAALRGRSILTVGDSDGFARRGGMIRFVTENKRIRLRISLDAAVAGKLTISSKLLKFAEIIPPGGS